MDHPHEATSTLLAQLPVATLNAMTEDADISFPVSGDDLAFMRADLAGRIQ